MSSADSHSIEILTNIPVYLYQYGGIALYIIGNIGNLLSIFIFSKKSWRKNVCVFYFLICLLSNTVFINSALLGAIISFGFTTNAQNVSAVLCKLFYYVPYFFAIYFPIVLVLASVDRLLISSQNVDTRLYSSKRLAYFSTSISAVILAIFSFHILVRVSIQEVYPTVFICYYDLSPFYLNFIVYSSSVIGVVIPFLLIILSILAFKNVRHVRPVPRQQRNQVRTMHKKDFQLLRCLYVHNIIYIIFTFLMCVSIVYSTTKIYGNEGTLELVVQDFLHRVSYFLHSIPYCTSFFVFVIVSKAFRQEFKRFVHKTCGKNVTAVREEENNQQEPVRDNIELNNVISTIVLPS